MVKSTRESSFSVSVGILLQLIRYLLHLEVDIDEFLLSVDLDSSILNSPDERIAVEKYILIEKKAADISKDPCFGLHMGQFTETGNWSILGYLMMNCKTIGEAFGKFEKYSNIIGNLIKADVCIDKDKYMIFLKTPPNSLEISRHCYEGYFSSIFCLAQNLSGKSINPIEVGLAFPEPKSIEEYNKVFGCSVLFGKENNYITFEKRVINTPGILPNDNLLIHFENYAQEFLMKSENQYSTSNKVKKLILSQMDNEKITIHTIAAELSVSVRTLQINLEKEGNHFSSLLKDTRIQLAKKYLIENYTVEDITYLLGFSESCTFRKAFKQWVGYTPKEFRDKHALKCIY